MHCACSEAHDNFCIRSPLEKSNTTGNFFAFREQKPENQTQLEKIDEIMAGPTLNHRGHLADEVIFSGKQAKTMRGYYKLSSGWTGGIVE